jgi:gluconokinase
MGVAGSGKSTLMAELAQLLGWPTLEGDSLHPAANVARMAAGVPLTDLDRKPWLAAVHAWLRRAAVARRPVIVTCSALRRRYRQALREGVPGVVFVHLDAPRAVLEARMRDRTGHFMPPQLLDSQLETLEPLHAEPGFVVDATRSPAAVADEVVERLGLGPSRAPAVPPGTPPD